MKKQILISLLLLILLITSVSAHEMDNATDSEVSLDDNPIDEIKIENGDDGSNLTTQTDLITSPNPEKTNISQDSILNNNQNHEILKANVDDSDELLRQPSNIIYVSPTGSGTGASADDPTSWTSALTGLQDNTIVYFLDGIYEINSVISKNNIILQALNTGAATIDAGRTNYAFRITGRNATIAGLNIINSANSYAVYATNSITVTDCSFSDNEGGVYCRGDVTVSNSKFTNNTSPDQGGGIYASGNAEITDCEFKDNTADASGGAVMAGTLSCANSRFVNNTSIRGGGAAIYTRTSANITKSEFIDNTAHTFGGAVSSNINDIEDSVFIGNTVENSGGAVNGNTNNIKNSNFTDNSAENSGGAIYSFDITNLDNCNLENNNASRGGAVYSNQHANVKDSTFTNNTCDSYGGAVYANSQVDITNSEFRKNSAGEYGGAVYNWGGEANITSSKFIENNADESGGAVIGGDITVKDSEFDQNTAQYYGGAVYAIDANVDNSQFSNNNAGYSGGAIFTDNADINSSNFTKNSAINGGALLSEKANVSNSRFTQNSAFDGGAIDCDSLNVDKSYFEANTAKTYGTVYTVNATIKNSEFKDNSALNNTQIYALNSLELINTTIPENEYTQADTTPDYIKNITEDRIIQLESGLEGYCTQRTISWTNGDVYVMDELDILRNQLTGEYIGEYLKILLYNFYENRTQLASAVWAFTDSDFRNSDNEFVKETVRLYDSGFRVPDKGATLILKNKTQIVIDFFSAGKSSTQNLFLYNVTTMGENYNLTIEKIALNNTVKLGESSSFDIIVKNTGDTILHNVRVEEASYDDLEFLSWTSLNGSWKHIIENGKHIFVLDTMRPNETFMFRVAFKTTRTGLKTNVVVVGSNETNKTNTTNKTSVVDPKMKIQKITLTPIVKLGQIVRFEIIVSNIGDVDLGDVSVIEYNFDGLKYMGFTSKNGVWRHVIRNNKHVFVLENPLKVNESMSFIISFKTTKIGDFENTVIGQSNETEPVTGKNSTKVVSDNKTDNKTKPNKTQPENPVYKDEHATGNPLAVLLCAVAILVSDRIYKRKR